MAGKIAGREVIDRAQGVRVLPRRSGVVAKAKSLCESLCTGLQVR